MKRRLLHLGVLVLCMSLACALLPAAYAEDLFTLNVDTLNLDLLSSDDYVSRHLSSGAQGIRVRKHVSDSSESAAHVRLTLTRMDSRTLIFDKDYGYVSGTFDSGAIYLPSDGDGTMPYLVTLYVGDTGYGLPFMQVQPARESEWEPEWDDGWADDSTDSSTGWADSPSTDDGWSDDWSSDAPGWARRVSPCTQHCAGRALPCTQHCTAKAAQGYPC